MSFSFRRVTRALLVLPLLFTLVGAGCTKLETPETQNLKAPVSLEVWSVIDDQQAYAESIKAYSQRYPNVSINLRRLRLEDYETELLNAMAEDRGPDIFLLHHDWTNKYLSKLAPMPNSVRVAERVVTGTVKKEVTWQAVTVPFMTNREYRDAFVDTVARDTIRTVDVSTDPTVVDRRERIVGIPTFIDTLALYYNRSLLNAAGIPLPPETWDDFQGAVRKLTRLDARERETIQQSGAALGTGANVERSVDILTALMMQNGAQMADINGTPTFHVDTSGDPAVQEPPSFGAIRFYAEFADPTRDVYTWNADQPNSFEAFLQGKTAMFFGYAYQQELIQAQAPQINLGVTKLPQIPGRPSKNVANYWYWGVSKRSQDQNHAWNFLNFLAQKEQQQQIAKVLKRPSPRRDVLAEQLRDESVGTFAAQVLTASTWYAGRDPRIMEQAFVQMMDSIARKETTVEDAVKFVIQRVSDSY